MAPVGHVRPTEHVSSATTPSSQGRRARLGPLFGQLSDLGRDVDETETHFARAEDLDHPLEEVRTDLPADLTAAMDMICDLMHDTPRERLRRVRILREAAQSLLPMSSKILAAAPAHVREAAGPDANPAFVAALITAIEWPDESFPRDHFVLGHEIIGQTADFGIWRLKDPETQATEQAHLLPVAGLRDGVAQHGPEGTRILSNMHWNLGREPLSIRALRPPGRQRAREPGPKEPTPSTLPFPKFPQSPLRRRVLELGYCLCFCVS